MVEGSGVSEEKFQEYWSKMKGLTIVMLLLWTIPAFWMHVPVSTTQNIKILGGIPLHWFLAGFVAVVFGIALIFIYAIIMDKWDREILGK